MKLTLRNNNTVDAPITQRHRDRAAARIDDLVRQLHDETVRPLVIEHLARSLVASEAGMGREVTDEEIDRLAPHHFFMIPQHVARARFELEHGQKTKGR